MVVSLPNSIPVKADVFRLGLPVAIVQVLKQLAPFGVIIPAISARRSEVLGRAVGTVQQGWQTSSFPGITVSWPPIYRGQDLCWVELGSGGSGQ